MKHKPTLLFMFLWCFLLSGFQSGYSAVEAGGILMNDTTWTNSDTIIVISQVTVMDTVCLTVEAGAVVLFNNNTRLLVLGEFAAEGTPTSPIVFSSRADTLGGSPTPGGWYGLDMQSGSISRIKHCHIKYIVTGVYVYLAEAVLSDCIIENFLLNGIYVNGSPQDTSGLTLIERCMIRQTLPSTTGTASGIFGYQASKLKIIRSRISGCKYGLDFLSYSTDHPQFEVTYCDIRDNTYDGIYARTSG